MNEYHYGNKNLEAKLRNAGFAVIHTEPILFNDYDGKRIIGMIYAERLKRSETLRNTKHLLKDYNLFIF